jgi:hypothetical protein
MEIDTFESFPITFRREAATGALITMQILKT